MKLPQMMTDVYVYAKESGKTVYSLGLAVEKENKWDSGIETIQRVNEIKDGGRTSYALYRKHQIFGKTPTGEKLTNCGLSAESKFVREVADIAAQDSILEALEFVVSGNANPLIKLLLEKHLFEQLRKDPIFSGLVYSKTALAREALINKHSRGVSYHSWLFEDGPRKRFIEKELYSKSLPDLKKEAKICINSIVITQKSPLKMIGVVLENGKKSIFADSKSAVWAVNKAGVFECVASRIDVMGSVAELSPIFSETKSFKQIKDEASETLK